MKPKFSVGDAAFDLNGEPVKVRGVCWSFAYLARYGDSREVLLQPDEIYFSRSKAATIDIEQAHDLLQRTPLTRREIQVIQLLAGGKTNKLVAEELGVSTRTVESHRNHVMRKMNFTSFADLIRFSLRTNLMGS